jgi:hypothetical protein
MADPFSRLFSTRALFSFIGAAVPRDLMLYAHDGHKAFVVALDNDPAGQRGREKARNETVNGIS